ncbi:hypothetical protein N7512_004658 [Penicillium capsulatum]|nr:hypothetical protein N7512_004658 [Penicillium capsulatum]
MSDPLLQVPQHVTALLSHLTSRPGVQSTLILSRKDGRIIQSTGLLAPQDTRPTPIASTTEPTQVSSSGASPSSSAPPTPSSYQPSQAETLATHIFTFVSSASALGGTLSRPTQSTGDNHTPAGLDDNYDTYSSGTGTPRVDDKEVNDGEREEDDEVKLLRMRTKKHEIVVVPDRKYLLCVVHDAAPGSGGSGGGGPRSR